MSNCGARDGVRVAWVQSSWGTLLEDMLRDRFDIAIGGMTHIQYASCAQVCFTHALGGATRGN